jgi:hypothetical protein
MGSAFGSGLGAAGSGVCSPEQHDFRFFFVVVASTFSLGFGAGTGSGFEQQQPFVTCSTTGQAHEAGALAEPCGLAFERKAANTGMATAGVSWPIKARTASTNRRVARRICTSARIR